MNKVEKFINNFKAVFPDELESVFYNGYCYWFAFILASRFHGEIWFNPVIVHFAARIRDKDTDTSGLYDIYGKVTPGVDPITGDYDELNAKWIEWGKYQTRYQDESLQIIASCIKKE